jgi:hypothetical protein
MSREKRCQFNGEACAQELIGRGVSKYCSGCRDEARKRDKKQRNQADYDALWDPENEGSLEHHRQENRRLRYFSYHDLTKHKLHDFFDCVESQQKDCPRSKYDGYEYALKEFHEVESLILNPDPHVDLPSAAKIANKRVKKLLKSLEDQKKDFRVSVLGGTPCSLNDLPRGPDDAAWAWATRQSVTTRSRIDRETTA